MTTTPRLGLPLLAAGQAQKEVAHNEALMNIDFRLHSAVQTRTLASPPLSPAIGDMYLVAAAAEGAWAGRSGSLAGWDGLGWRFVAPVVGSLVWVVDEGGFAVYDGDWARVTGLAAEGAGWRPVPEMVAAPEGGAAIDPECRAALAGLLATLRKQGLVL